MKTTMCICCGRELENFTEDSIQPLGGLAFRSYGHYGSSIFDPVGIENMYLELTVCDPCVLFRLSRIYGTGKQDLVENYSIYVDSFTEEDFPASDEDN
jgi:hypothetical protein